MGSRGTGGGVQGFGTGRDLEQVGIRQDAGMQGGRGRRGLVMAGRTGRVGCRYEVAIRGSPEMGAVKVSSLRGVRSQELRGAAGGLG